MAKIPVNFSQFEQLDISKANTPGRSIYSDVSELLRSRANVLSGKDRALLKMYLDRGVPFRQIARLSSVDEGSVRRRISKLISGLLGSEYMTCIHNKDKLSRLEMKVAKDHFVSGMSQKKIAKKNKCSVYYVRKSLKNIHRLLEDGQ